MYCFAYKNEIVAFVRLVLNITFLLARLQNRNNSFEMFHFPNGGDIKKRRYTDATLRQIYGEAFTVNVGIGRCKETIV